MGGLMPFKDIKGNRCGRLVALERLDKSGNGDFNWRCKCDCGNYCITTIGRLNSGNTKSCGCYKSEVLKNHNMTHGMTKTPEYVSWRKMKERCLNENDISYPNYGGNGVEIHPDFIHSFEKFYNEVGSRPTDKHSLDRIDNNLGYTYGNLKWSTKKEQDRNKTLYRNNTSGKCGVKYDIKSYDSEGKPSCYWVASWYDLNGKLKQKAYSIKKYGDELARFLAEETRDLAIQYLNNNGAGYTEGHGKLQED